MKAQGLNRWVTGVCAGVLIFGLGLMSETAKAEDPPEPQVWTYDFGDEEGVFDSGDQTNPDLLPSTQVDGGDTRLRIGGGNSIILSEDENDVGTFSRMILEASPSGSLNFFETGNFAENHIHYYKSSIEISADGENNLIYFWIGSNDSFGSNNQNLSDVFFALRWEIDDEGLETRKRTSGGSWNLRNVNQFDLDEQYKVEVYINNSSNSSKTYYRNGKQFEISQQYWHLWLDNTKIESREGVTSNLDPGDEIGLIRYYGGRSSGEDAQIEIDDIVYANHFPVYREVTGDEGWRMLSAPTEDLDVLTLARQNQVQGVSGDEIDISGDPNIFEFTGENEWQAPAAQDDKLNPGEGFIWYLWDNDNVLPSKPLPMGLVSKGDVPDSDVTVSLHTDEVGAGDEYWNLVGNPFGQDLDISDIGDWADGDLESVVGQVWDHNAGSYQQINAEDDVAAFQGFFIENKDATELTIPESATTGDATFYREENDDTRLISLQLSGEDRSTEQKLVDNAANVYFNPEASFGWDMWSASKLMPLTQQYAILSLKGERDGEERNLSQHSLPTDLDDVVTIPLEIKSTPDVSGDFTIDIESLENIPEQWQITVSNEETGETYDLIHEAAEVEINDDSNARMRDWNHITEENYIVANDDSHNIIESWTLSIDPSEVTSSDADAELPEELTLDQNYPNPFNPVTTISYAIPDDAQVELAVYDVMGRRVATLVDEQRSAGTYEVSWDASDMASGTYMYRLQVNNQVQTRTMTLIK